MRKAVSETGGGTLCMSSDFLMFECFSLSHSKPERLTSTCLDVLARWERQEETASKGWQKFRAQCTPTARRVRRRQPCRGLARPLSPGRPAA